MVLCNTENFIKMYSHVDYKNIILTISKYFMPTAKKFQQPKISQIKFSVRKYFRILKLTSQLPKINFK